MRHLYSLLWYVLTPLLMLRLLWRSRRVPAYRQRLAERFGLFPAPADVQRPAIWVHAVSVGEVMAALPLLQRLRVDYPGHRLIVTTTTPTGSARVRDLLGDQVFHVYLPWDLPGSVRRFLRRTRPRLLLLLETELWPNLVHQARARGCRVLLVNARLSAASARGYTRVGPLVRPMLAALDETLCRSLDDSERFLSLGANSDRMKVVGNLKWEARLAGPDQQRGERWRRDWGAERQPLLLAASTHPHEEEQVLAAFTQLRGQLPDCRLLLAPRHPERARHVAALCRQAGFTPVMFSRGELASGEVIVVDTIGDLPALYGAATVAFIGGSLVPRGGHNPVEAILWGVPLLGGPHLDNFPDMAGALEQAGALGRVADALALAQRARQLLLDSDERERMAGAARTLLQDKRGALATTLEAVARQLR